MRLAVKLSLGLLFTLMFTGVYSDHDLIRPIKIPTTSPGDDVPPSCAWFFNAAGWGDGSWDGGRAHKLHVATIESDCSATVFYGYGGWHHDGTGDWFLLPAKIERGRLIVAIPEHNAVATYQLSHDLMTLSGVWEKTDESSTAYVTLKRLD